MTLVGCPLSIFCSRGTPSIVYHTAQSLPRVSPPEHPQSVGVYRMPVPEPVSSSLLLSSLELSDAKVYEPQTRARLGTAAHFCEVVVLKLKNVSASTELPCPDWGSPRFWKGPFLERAFPGKGPTTDSCVSSWQLSLSHHTPSPKP